MRIILEYVIELQSFNYVVKNLKRKKICIIVYEILLEQRKLLNINLLSIT